MELLYTIYSKDYVVELTVRYDCVEKKHIIIDAPPIVFKVAMGKEINVFLRQLSVWNMLDRMTVAIVGLTHLQDFFYLLEEKLKCKELVYNPEGKVVHEGYTPLVLRKDLQIKRLDIKKNYHPLNPLGLERVAKQINKPESAYMNKIFKLEL